MNNMTATEANQNFTAFTRKVDAEGVVGIEKNSKLKYVMMTKERYENMNKKVFYGKRGEDLIKLELGDDRAAIFSIWLEDGKLEHMVYTIVEAPKDVVEVSEKGSCLKIKANLDEKKEGERASVISSEAFLDEDGKSVFLPPEPTFEADVFEANCIKRCLAVVKEFEGVNALETEVSVTRRGREEMEEYLKAIEGKQLWTPGKRTPRQSK